MISRIKESMNIARHKLAFMEVRRNNTFLRENISLYRALMHDTGKMINVLLLGDNLATKIHRKMAGHHQESRMTFSQQVEAICDWECARLTKPEKPLNGFRTWVKYYQHVPNMQVNVIIPFLKNGGKM